MIRIAALAVGLFLSGAAATWAQDLACSVDSTGGSVGADGVAAVIAGAQPAAGSFTSWGTIGIQDSGAGFAYTVDADLPPIAQILAEEDASFTAQALVAARSGGRVERPDKAAVVIPADAAASDLTITVSSAQAATMDEQAAQKRERHAAGMRHASDPVEFGPEGTRFSKPVMIILPYDPSLVAAYGLTEKDLRVNYWNKASQTWEPLDSAVDPANHTVSAQTSHFSLYQVLGPAAPAPAQATPSATADASFALRDVYAFPNPAVKSAATIRVQVGLADSVEAHFYDISGQLVGSASGSTPSIIDDGNGKGPQYTYDLSWNPSSVGSGVYLYVVTAKKPGAQEIRAVRRLAVIK